MNESAEEIPQLTPDELQDLVTVETAPSEPAAAFVIGVLEDAGIPAVSHGGHVIGFTGGMPSVDVRVPRKLAARARILIVEAMEKIREGRLDEAFDPALVEEALEDPRHDPILDKMNELRYRAPEFRNATLRRHVLDWLNTAQPADAIATYLAAAGLNREEANNLVESVQGSQEYSDQPHKTLLLIGGILLILLAVVVAAIKPGAIRQRSALSVFPIVGLVMIMYSRKDPVSLSRKEKNPGEPK